MPVPQQAEASPIPEEPELERLEVAPHIEITSAPPDEDIEDETGPPPLKEAAARLEEAAAALAALRETTAPPAAEGTPQEPEEKAGPESVVFDKAEQAELVEDLRERHRLMGEELKKMEGSLRDKKDDVEREKLQSQIDWHKSQMERLGRFLESELEEEN